MNKKFIIAWVVVFVVWMLGSFLVHGLLLRSDYLRLGSLFRTDAEQQPFIPLMLLAHVLMAGAFVWIYARGVESKPWVAQGARFGLAVALLGVVPTYIIYFVVQPMPAALVIKQVVFDGILTIVLGVVAAWAYRDAGIART